MVAIGKFGKKPSAAAAPAAGGFRRGARPATAAAPPPRRRLFPNLGSGGDRFPMPQVGGYRFQVLMCEYRISPKDNITPHVVANVLDLETASTFSLVFGVGTNAGGAEYTRFFRTACGFESDDAFFETVGATTPEAQEAALADLGEACVGESNQFSEDGTNPIIDRLVDGNVTRGKDDGKGDWYRKYEWAVVPDEEQGAE